MTSAAVLGPKLPVAKMHLYRPSAPVIARITRSEVCTASRKSATFVRHVEFDVSGTSLVGNCLPGQSIGVIPPGADAKGRPHAVRLYSLASPTAGENANPALISTTVKRTIDEHWDTHRLFLGIASNYLCDLHVGDEVRLSGPNGKRFLIPSNPADHDYLLFATGTGIAPFRGMTLDLLAAGCASSITLIMGAAYRSDLLYHDLFLRLQHEHPNFRYLTAISRERDDEGGPGVYVQDRLRTHRDALAPILANPRTLVYICGVAGMELGILRQMANALAGSALEQYIEVDQEALTDPAPWTRAMLHKRIKLTRRVFLEVYD